MNRNIQSVISEIDRFRHKYIRNLILRGLIISLSALLVLFLVINILEYSFRFGVNTRTFLFFSFAGITLSLLTVYVFMPAAKLLMLDSAIATEEAANRIGQYFPEIKDKLLNIIQLQKNNSSAPLVYASIDQKIRTLPPVKFTGAVSYRQNNRLIPWLVVPLVIFVGLFGFKPGIITESATRLANYNKAYIPAAPFSFILENSDLKAFKNEDFEISLLLEGEAIPNDAYLNLGNRKLKMRRESNNIFKYTVRKPQRSASVSFEAAGFASRGYELHVLERPDLRSFNMFLRFPTYLNRKAMRLENVGSSQIPEGTTIKWQLNTLHADSAFIRFEAGDSRPMRKVDSQLFEYRNTIAKTQEYEIAVTNRFAGNKAPMQYLLEVIKDEYPKISASSYQDSLLYAFVSLGGDISDDHGITGLKLYYATDNDNFRTVDIPIDRKQKVQRFYYQWNIDSLITESPEIKYYLKVTDNDGFNGRKSTKTAIYTFKVPDKKEIRETIDKVAQQTEKDIDETLKEAQELKKELQKAEQRMRGKNKLNWQDNKLIKDLIKKREELSNAIEELKEQNRQNELKREQFDKQNERIKEKVESLQKLMDELLDEETKKLYDELKKLLEEQKDIENVQELIKEINNKENNLEQELERTLELYKRMKLDLEVNEAIEDLKEQIEEQEALMRETDSTKGQEEDKYGKENDQEKEKHNNNSKKKNNDSKNLTEKQKQLQEKFKDLEDKLEDIKEQNKSLKNPESMPDMQEEQESVKQNQQESKESLEKGEENQAKENQQKAKEAMEKMAEKMEQMQASMQMQAMQENLEDLRAIVHNLIQLSFDQENLMAEFSEVEQSDPRFVELSQKQLKLKDDSQIVQDSLLALAKRVFQIASFVTREVTDMNEHMDKSVTHIKARNKGMAVSEQQFSMTSMNNLALLLDDVLQQMQSAMADAMGKPQKKKGNQPKTPSMSELQQQLNDKIEKLKGSGKTGRQLSEELAELAAEQERIRKVLEKAQENFGEKDGGQKPGSGITEKMEETETDLVNKQITQETIRRQKQILTRMLEAEDALKEQELDQERKGETANDYEKRIPDAFEEYFKLKEQEIEFLRTIPPRLYPYYKNEVNRYFNRIHGQPNNTKSE